MIYLVRHGKIQVKDDQRRYIGQLDVPLTEEGIRQAQNLQKRMERVDFTAIFCSDLGRSRQTAEIIVGAKNTPIISQKELREIDLGEWEGLSFADVVRRFPAEFKSRGADIGYYRAPGGESFADCSKRVVIALHEIMKKSRGNILIVGHAGINRLLLCHVLGMPLTSIFRLVQDYGCLNIIQYSSSGYQVKLTNLNLMEPLS